MLIGVIASRSAKGLRRGNLAGGRWALRLRSG